jgi:tRNA-modifying protein YgfZ
MIFDLSSRTKLCLQGQDRVRYLNGQVTNDVRQAKADAVTYACVTDVKGKITADLFLHAEPERLLLDAEPELREVLALRLERYIISEDVELTDVTDEWQLWHLTGEDAEPLQGHAGAVRADRLGESGLDLWLPAGEPLPFDVSRQLSAGDWEHLRIQRGIPRFQHELNAGAFPPEAGIESTAMSYSKGCYIGQEILSRIRTTGKMPQRLVYWSSAKAVTAGAPLFLSAEAGQAVGQVTSVAPAADSAQGWVGMAYVRQAYARLDSELLAGAELPNLCVSIQIISLVNR